MSGTLSPPRWWCNIGPSPTLWQVKAARCQFRSLQRPLLVAIRARRWQLNGNAPCFLAGNEPLVVKSARKIRQQWWYRQRQQMHNGVSEAFVHFLVQNWVLLVSSDYRTQNVQKGVHTTTMQNLRNSAPGTSLQELKVIRQCLYMQV